MKIAIFGTRYVCRDTGMCHAEVGHEIMCVDIESAKVSRYNPGQMDQHGIEYHDIGHGKSSRAVAA